MGFVPDFMCRKHLQTVASQITTKKISLTSTSLISRYTDGITGADGAIDKSDIKVEKMVFSLYAQRLTKANISATDATQSSTQLNLSLVVDL